MFIEQMRAGLDAAFLGFLTIIVVIIVVIAIFEAHE